MKRIVFIFAGLLSSGVLGTDSDRDPLDVMSSAQTDLSASWVTPGLDASVTSLASERPEESVVGSVQSLDGNIQPGATPIFDGGDVHLPVVEEEAPSPAIHSQNIFNTAAQEAVLEQVQATIAVCPDVAALERLANFGDRLSLAARTRINVLTPPPPAPQRTWLQTRLDPFADHLKPWMNRESLACIAFVATAVFLKWMGYSDCKI